MDRTACTEPQCLYNGALYLYPYIFFTLIYFSVLKIFLFISCNPKENFLSHKCLFTKFIYDHKRFRRYYAFEDHMCVHIYIYIYIYIYTALTLQCPLLHVSSVDDCPQWTTPLLNHKNIYSNKNVIIFIASQTISQNCVRPTLIFVMSVRHCVRPHLTTRLPLEEFSWNLIFDYFSKICRGNSSFVTTWQI